MPKALLPGLLLSVLAAGALAHGVSKSDKGFLQGATGVQFLPYL